MVSRLQASAFMELKFLCEALLVFFCGKEGRATSGQTVFDAFTSAKASMGSGMCSGDLDYIETCFLFLFNLKVCDNAGKRLSYPTCSFYIGH